MKQRSFKVTVALFILFIIADAMCIDKLSQYQGDLQYTAYPVFIFILSCFSIAAGVFMINGYVNGDHLPD